MSAPLPIVAVVGRPNVGKSTLFNRLAGRRLAIVHDQPGVTRDRHYAETRCHAYPYTLVDTGGFDPEGEDDMQRGITSQIEVALSEADILLCVLDATGPPTPIDRAEMALLRRTGKPVLFIANKCDSDRQQLEGHDLYRLGMENLLFASALHGRGMGALETALAEALAKVASEQSEPPEGPEDALRVAIVGRPNAGKSSLINRLLGEERLLVDSRPGTTRDPIDSIVERRGQRYVLVDTAGLRRKARVAKSRDTVEALSVMSAVRAIGRARVVVLLCDAVEGAAEQDTKVLSLALDKNRGVVIGLNKIDQLSRDAQREALRQAREVFSFASWAPICTLSAMTGRGVSKVLEKASEVDRQYGKRVGTSELNRFFSSVLEEHPPPVHGGRSPRFYYITQAQTSPPTFVIMTSHPDNLHFSYQRYVINAIRKSFGFEGVPIRVKYRRPDRNPKAKKK